MAGLSNGVKIIRKSNVKENKVFLFLPPRIKGEESLLRHQLLPASS
jgi:hypothetical protein